MKKYLILALLICSTFVYGRKENRTESYNYTRGVEEFNNDNYEEALSYFNKEVSDNPKDGYAYCWMAFIYNNQGELGYALSASNNAIKYIPKKDTYNLALSYNYRASVYFSLGDTIKALEDIDTAIKIAPNQIMSYSQRAGLYYELKQYNLAQADYSQIIKLYPASASGYMGLGRCYNEQKMWSEAVENFNRVINLYNDYAPAYSNRAKSYIGLNDYANATDDIVKALSMDGDDEAFELMQELDGTAFDMLKVKLKVQADKNPNDFYWPYYLGTIYENQNLYEKALSYYLEANSKDSSTTTLSRISSCYYALGDFEQALNYVNMIIELNPTNLMYLSYKAVYLRLLGMPQEAIKEINKVQQEYPEVAQIYDIRGDLKAFCRDFDGTIEDLTTSIFLDSSNVFPYFERGDIYAKQGKIDLAMADYKKVIELEDAPEKYEYSMFAYHSLGQDDKAIEVIDTFLSRSKNLQHDYYQAACLYSRMENKEKALEYLSKAFEEGYNQFNHIRMDYDMDFLRDFTEFNILLDEYENQHKTTLTNESSQDTGEVVISEIPFTKDHGLCQVECKVNDLPLSFVFDTGASVVTMSMVEATFMMKNGYFTDKDVIGSSYFSDANGNVNVGTIINLRQVEFGGLTLENVRASVVRNQRAPLLLGQSVLSRLGKIEIDNNNHILRITHSK